MPQCLNRVGAGSTEIDGSEDAAFAEACNGQLDRYRSCLGSIAQLCGDFNAGDGATRSGGASASEMLAVWAEIKDSQDADALEAFANNFSGAALATLAEKRAADIRAQGAAEAIWGQIKDFDEPDVFDTFAARHPTSPRAAEAKSRAKALREGTAATPTDQALAIAPPPPPAVDQAALEAERARIRAAQRDLNRIGYDAGPADGVMGPRTRAALIAFQRAANLDASGAPTDATLAALSASPTPSRPVEPAVSAPSESAPTTSPSTERSPRSYRAEFEIDSNRSWSPYTDDCETRIDATDGGPGPTRFRATELRCGSMNVTYDFTVDVERDTVTGELQIFATDGTTPPIAIAGTVAEARGRLNINTVRVRLSEPR